MVCEIIGKTVLSNVIVQMGEKSIGLSSETVEKTASKVQNIDPAKVDGVGVAGSAALALVQVITPYENRPEFHESTFGFSALISSSLIGIFILKCIEGKHRIKDLQATLFSMQEEFEALAEQTGNLALQEKKEKLAAHINLLEQHIFRECLSKQRMFDLVLSKSCQGSLSSLRQVAIVVNSVQPGTSVAASFGTTSGVAVAVCPLLALFFGSKSLRKVVKTINKLHKEREKIEALLDEIEVPVKRLALSLRLLNLKKQEEELTIKASRDLFTITSGALGTGATIKLLTTSIGMGAGFIFGTALTATGIGAIVTGAIAILIGTAYVAKKNEEEIHYFAQDKQAALEQSIMESYHSYLQLRKDQIQSKFKRLEGYMNQTRDEAKEEFYRKKIDEAWDKIQELKGHLTDTKQLHRLEKKHQELIFACIGQKLGGKKIASHDLDWTLILHVNEKQKRVERAAVGIESIKGRRKALNDHHLYHKFLSKFGTFLDGAPVTVDHLKAFENHFMSATYEEKLGLTHLFFDHMVPITNEAKTDWLESMKAITAPIV